MSEMMQILAGLSASVSQLSSKVDKQTSMLELQASASRLAEPPTTFSGVLHFLNICSTFVSASSKMHEGGRLN